MKRLIVNADDLGLAEGINTGIIKAFTDGIVTSASLMANGCAFDHAVALIKTYPSLAIGIHIVLVEEFPVCAPHLIPSLINGNGRLYKDYKTFLWRILTKRISLDDVKTEMRAQIEKILNVGIKPTHVDSHQHLHVYPAILHIVLQLAKEYGIQRIRMPYDSMDVVGVAQRVLRFLAKVGKKHVLRSGLQTTDAFFGAGCSGHLIEEHIVEVIEKLPNGVSELMCHPGVENNELNNKYRHWNFWWQKELEALTSKSVKEMLKVEGVKRCEGWWIIGN
jgi:hopanoid biosynthesis associated protein HpnK